MGRKQVNIGTYNVVKSYITSNPSLEFTATKLRDDLKIDYYSILYIIDLLVKEKIIIKTDNKYKCRC